jgi:hypothetical protein
MLKRLRWPIIGVAVVAFVAGFLVASWLDSPIITTGRADTTEGGGGSISTDDWTYGFSADVDWIDEAGSRNSGSQPECLRAGESVNVRFAATEVTVEGITWRPVLWIDCRTASAP